MTSLNPDPGWSQAQARETELYCRLRNRQRAQELAGFYLRFVYTPVDEALCRRIVALIAEQGCVAQTVTPHWVRQRLHQLRQARPEWWGEQPREYAWDQRLRELDRLSRVMGVACDTAQGDFVE
ncbi:hypothetical protein [Magnetofaba australis]|nr:hypothetical protein [Magnetofaba australis]